jgi:hypothetical protein
MTLSILPPNSVQTCEIIERASELVPVWHFHLRVIEPLGFCMTSHSSLPPSSEDDGKSHTTAFLTKNFPPSPKSQKKFTWSPTTFRNDPPSLPQRSNFPPTKHDRIPHKPLYDMFLSPQFPTHPFTPTKHDRIPHKNSPLSDHLSLSLTSS